MNIPKPSKEDKDFFASHVPKDARVSTKLVFGNDAAFVNGNMFFGIYGKDVFVRLPEDKAKELLEEKGSGAFEPMPGHAMTGYYVVPKSWKGRPQVQKWITTALDWTSTLPPKKPKK